MLPSMPLIAVQADSNTREEDATPSSSTNDTCVSSSDMSQHMSPRCSPDSVMGVKKASPLKHVTPILRKYSVHRKAKADKKAGLSCVSPRNHAEVSPTRGEEAEGEDAPDIPEFDPPSSPLENKDNEEELAALMRASSTITRKTLGPPTKKSRHAKELELTLFLLQPEDASAKDQREHHMALTYLTKVQEELTEEQFCVFIQALTSAEPDKPGGVTRMYSEVCSALASHTHLAEEFLLFLEPAQALECGAFMQHQKLSHMTDFISKLQAYFTRQPHVVRMVIASLATLVEQPGVTEEDVQATVLPLLKGCSLLTDCFLRLLPLAKPPESLMTDFEEVVCEEMENLDDEGVETLHVPLHNVKDMYGGDMCMCTCHVDTQDDKFKSRVEHCMPCGLKFIHGKMFLQSGRTLRPAKVTFLNEDMASAIKRLTPLTAVRTRRRRNGNSFSLDDMDMEYTENLSSPKSRRGSKAKLKCAKSHLLSPNGSSSSDTNPECRKTSTGERALTPCGQNGVCHIPTERLSPCENPLSPCENGEHLSPCEALSPCGDENILSPCNDGDENILSPCNDMEALSPCNDMEALSPCNDMEALSPCNDMEALSPCNDMEALSPCNDLDAQSGDEHMDMEVMSPAEPDSTVDEDLEEELLEEEELEEEEEEEFFDDVIDDSSQEEQMGGEQVSTSDEGPRSSTPKSSEVACSVTSNGISSLNFNGDTSNNVATQSNVEAASQSINSNGLTSQNANCNGVASQSNVSAASQSTNSNILATPNVTSHNSSVSRGVASYSPPSSSTALSNVTSNSTTLPSVTSNSGTLSNVSNSATLQVNANLSSQNRNNRAQNVTLNITSPPNLSSTLSNVTPQSNQRSTAARSRCSTSNSPPTSSVGSPDKEWSSVATSSVRGNARLGSPDKDPCWTRDEDKAILQAFQQGGTSQRMLLTVRQLLPERTPDQIMSRFHILLKLLQQMSSAARDRK